MGLAEMCKYFKIMLWTVPVLVDKETCALTGVFISELKGNVD